MSLGFFLELRFSHGTPSRIRTANRGVDCDSHESPIHQITGYRLLG